MYIDSHVSLIKLYLNIFMFQQVMIIKYKSSFCIWSYLERKKRQIRTKEHPKKEFIEMNMYQNGLLNIRSNNRISMVEKIRS